MDTESLGKAIAEDDFELADQLVSKIIKRQINTQHEDVTLMDAFRGAYYLTLARLFGKIPGF